MSLITLKKQNLCQRRYTTIVMLFSSYEIKYSTISNIIDFTDQIKISQFYGLISRLYITIINGYFFLRFT